MPTPNAAWTTYALLKSSQGGKEWRVQINPDGQFRCNCPSFIFCKGTKQCKHTRRCEQQRTQEQTAVAVAGKAMPVVVPPHVTEAVKIVGSMLTAAKTRSGLNVQAFCGPAGEQAMVDVLAAKLAAWVPPAKTTSSFAAAVEGGGIRHITFDD